MRIVGSHEPWTPRNGDPPILKVRCDKKTRDLKTAHNEISWLTGVQNQYHSEQSRLIVEINDLARDVDRLRRQRNHCEEHNAALSERHQVYKADLAKSQAEVGKLANELKEARSLHETIVRQRKKALEDRDTAFADKNHLSDLLTKEVEKVLTLEQKIAKITGEKEDAEHIQVGLSNRYEKSLRRYHDAMARMKEQRERISQILGPCEDKTFEEILEQWTHAMVDLREKTTQTEDKCAEAVRRAEAAERAKAIADQATMDAATQLSLKETALAEMRKSLAEGETSLTTTKSDFTAQVADLKNQLVAKDDEKAKALAELRQYLQDFLNTACYKSVYGFACDNGLSPPSPPEGVDPIEAGDEGSESGEEDLEEEEKDAGHRSDGGQA